MAAWKLISPRPSGAPYRRWTIPIRLRIQPDGRNLGPQTR